MPLVIVMVVSLIRGRPKPRATLFDGTHTAVVSRATRASVYEDMVSSLYGSPTPPNLRGGHLTVCVIDYFFYNLDLGLQMEKRAQEPLLDGESPTTARRGRVQYE